MLLRRFLGIGPARIRMRRHDETTEQGADKSTEQRTEPKSRYHLSYLQTVPGAQEQSHLELMQTLKTSFKAQNRDLYLTYNLVSLS